MKVSQLLILLLIALLYWTFYYLFSWKFIPHIESWLLSRYIPLEESERFQPFLTRSPNNLFDFTAFNDPTASRVSSPITNLSLVMIQPSDYVEIHNNGREEDDLVLSQNDSIIFDIRGPGLQSPISPPPSSSAISCLRVTAQLRHSTDFVSEVRELLFQLPMREDTDKIHVDLKISESFQLPAKCQTYRVHVSSETGFCYEQPRNTSYPIRFESTDPASTLYLSRLFYLLFLPDTHMVTKVLTDEGSTSHSEISPLTPSSKTDTSDAVPIPSTTPPPQKPPATSSQGSSKKKEETATMKMAESVLLLPKAVAIVAPANDAILKGMTSMNVTFAIPVTFYTLSDVMSLVLQVNDQQFDVTQSLLQIVPPSDMLERDIDNWQQHMQLLSPHTRAGADITSLKRFMQKSLISEESNSRYFLLRYLYLVWISLQEIPRGSYQLSLKAFVRTPSDEGSRSNEIELLGFDAIRFQAQ